MIHCHKMNQYVQCPVYYVWAIALARAAATFMLLQFPTKVHTPLGLGSGTLLVRWVAPKHSHEFSDLLQMSESILGHVIGQIAHEVHI